MDKQAVLALMENNTQTTREKIIKTKKNYKRAPLMPVHLRVMIAVVLGQISCGYALGIVVLHFQTQLNISISAIYGLG